MRAVACPGALSGPDPSWLLVDTVRRRLTWHRIDAGRPDGGSTAQTCYRTRDRPRRRGPALDGAKAACVSHAGPLLAAAPHAVEEERADVPQHQSVCAFAVVPATAYATASSRLWGSGQPIENPFHQGEKLPARGVIS